MTALMQQIEKLGTAHIPEMMALIQRRLGEVVGEDSSLVSMTEYHMRTGGKRLRALLPLVVAKTLGHDPDMLIPFGAACELLHNATLVHDDLQDGDKMRRGEPTIWVKYGPAQAINLGDAMLYGTLALVDDLELPVERRHLVTGRIVRETLRVVDGQEREFLLQGHELPTMEGYFKMVEGKTSGLFALPIVGAAQLCAAPEALLDVLQEATRHLGVVFQIQDDLLDLYGQKGRDRVGTDVAEGKISALVAYTLNHAKPKEVTWLRDLLRKDREDVSDEEIAKAIALFETSGAVQFAFDEIDRRTALANQDPNLQASPQIAELIRGLSDVFLAPVESVRQRFKAAS